MPDETNQHIHLQRMTIYIYIYASVNVNIFLYRKTGDTRSVYDIRTIRTIGNMIPDHENVSIFRFLVDSSGKMSHVSPTC